MILKRCFIFAITLSFVFSCYNFKEPEKPDNLIAKEKMINILIDAKLIGISNSTNRKIMRDSGVDPNAYIYQKYQIDSLQFALSNAYYAYHIKDYEDIYTKIDDSLERLLKTLKTQEEALKKELEKGIKDSVIQVQFVKDSMDILKRKPIDSLEKEGLIPPVSDKIDLR